jgi:peptidoglycan hydrolase-like protein with peptidoglycan-binding domain
MTDLPTTSKWVRLEELHPRFKKRLAAFFDHPEIRGKVAIVSGVRTVAAQQALYNKYKSGKGNLAANPARRFGGGFQGSWHMCQPAFDNYGFAVDFRIIKKGAIETWEVNNIAKSFGIYPTVKSEWWHHQPYGMQPNGQWDWFPAPAFNETGMTRPAKHPLQIIAEGVAEARKYTLRRGSRGDNVKFLQMLLENQNIPTATSIKRTRNGAGIDGIFGSGTDRAVRQFQRNESLTIDGIVGPATWEELIN